MNGPSRAGLLALLLAGIVSAGCKGEGYRSGVFEPPREAPDFVLEGSHGAPIALRSYRGKVVALAFGFSHCPRICPVTLSRLAEVDADFRGATSEPSKLDALQHAYGTIANRVQSENQQLKSEADHSTSIYLIDEQGILRPLVPFGEPAADILHDVKRLLDT